MLRLYKKLLSYLINKHKRKRNVNPWLTARGGIKDYCSFQDQATAAVYLMKGKNFCSLFVRWKGKKNAVKFNAGNVKLHLFVRERIGKKTRETFHG